MTVYDLGYYFVDPSYQNVIIYDTDKEENVFEGTFEDAMDSEYADCEVSSIDCIDKYSIENNNGAIVINIYN